MEDKNIIEILYAGIISVLSALVTAMVSVEKDVWIVVRTFIAGVSCGLLIGFILRESEIDQFYKYLWVALGSGFVIKLWPLAETLASAFIKRYFKSKHDESNNIPSDKRN